MEGDADAADDVMPFALMVRTFPFRSLMDVRPFTDPAPAPCLGHHQRVLVGIEDLEVSEFASCIGTEDTTPSGHGLTGIATLPSAIFRVQRGRARHRL